MKKTLTEDYLYRICDNTLFSKEEIDFFTMLVDTRTILKEECIDIDDEIEDMAREYINASPRASKIEFIVADALKWLEECDETFDLIFIDANKRHYIEYYNAVFDKLTPGGFILADNTLWGGKVVEKVANNDYQTKGLLAFNDYLNTQQDKISYFILPLRDGLTFIQKK
jgi:predicted O-methyltransferase YrrM